MASKAENVTFPFRSGTVANTPVVYYNCDSTSRADPIPAEMYGKYVVLTNDSANAAQFFISDDASSACDETIAAASPGARGAQLGGVILGNTSRQGRIPYPASTVSLTTNGPGGPGVPKTYYFVRASTAAATLRMELAEQ